MLDGVLADLSLLDGSHQVGTWYMIRRHDAASLAALGCSGKGIPLFQHSGSYRRAAQNPFPSSTGMSPVSQAPPARTSHGLDFVGSRVVGFGVQGLGFRVQGLGFRADGLGCFNKAPKSKTGAFQREKYCL